MIRRPTPSEEMEIRRQGEEAWRRTWASATDLTPKQAFIEGHYLAFWCGVMACSATREDARRRANQLDLQLKLALMALMALAVAVAWGLMQ
jgi:hypothetical protein